MNLIRILQNGLDLCSLADADPSASVLALLHRNGIAFRAPCGGNAKCGKCRVRLSGDVSAPGDVERARLSPAELAAGIRLACQARITGPHAQILLPETEDITGLLEGAAQVRALHPLGKTLGLAVDIGTTTVAAYLYDLQCGARLAADLMENPQRAFGADVTSRLSHSMNGGAQQLKASVCACINALADRLCKACGRSASEIDGAVLTGNTAMLYFLTGRDVADIAVHPFAAEERFGTFRRAADLSLRFSADCRVYLPRCMSAYVGADISCAILASGLMELPGAAMLADIGTNGEIVLRSGSRLLCCSTAAGPAFEGMGLSCGSCAVPGAVDAVWLAEGRPAFHALSGRTPASLCGSGALDLLACLLDSGRIDGSGRLTGGGDGISAYALTECVRLTQQDVRALQLAKAAVRAGMETLLRRAGTAEVDTLLLAGGFGSRLCADSALRIGMFPPWAQNRIRPVGNAAGMGAVRLLLDEPSIALCRDIADSAETLPLSGDPTFSALFVTHMSFEAAQRRP